MIIDGSAIAKKIEDTVARAAQKTTSRAPGLAFILVGNNPASKTYIQMKKKKCAQVGILSFDREFPDTLSEAMLLQEIEALNQNPLIDGILVQLPLPSHISSSRVMQAISPQKDVDGFHPLNVGKMLLGETGGFLPCTPLGIIHLLAESHIDPSGKHVVIVGRSNIVGKPLAAILMQKAPHCNATVTIANRSTENLKEMCRSADILIAAIGSAQFITKEMVKKGTVVIDVGINRVPAQGGGFRLVGDVDFEGVFPLCSHITPVPKGVGPMTIAMLLSNTLLSYQRSNS